MIKFHLNVTSRARQRRLKMHLCDLADSLIYILSLTLLRGTFRNKLASTGGLDFLDD